MQLHKTTCCAIQDIDQLRIHATPKEAMISFCQQAILKPPMFGKSVGARDQISSFYLFTAAIYPQNRYRVTPSPYGQNFYNFILTNKLGEVWESPSRPNKAWHPDHENQVYVWMPDHTAILAWWAANDPDKAVPIEAAITVKRTRKRKVVEVPVEGIPEPLDVLEECPF